MIRTIMFCSLLALIGQEKIESTTPSIPEVVRVLTIEARQVDGATWHLDPSLEPLRDLLEKVPGNHFTEKGFHELEASFGREAIADLGEGYTFHFSPLELTEDEEILFECHIDLEEGGTRLEALRVSGKAMRGQGAVFRGLTLEAGEMVVIMSIAKAEEDSGRGGSGGSGQTSEGVGGGAGDAGQDGQGEGGQSDENEDDEEPEVLIPELESREFERAQEEPVDPPEHTETAKEGEGAVAPDLATIEGILRALEEVDMAEQMSTRGRRFDVVIKGDWW